MLNKWVIFMRCLESDLVICKLKEHDVYDSKILPETGIVKHIKLKLKHSRP